MPFGKLKRKKKKEKSVQLQWGEKGTWPKSHFERNQHNSFLHGKRGLLTKLRRRKTR